MIQPEKILKALDAHGKTIKVVSFDVFNTLLDRIIPSPLVSHIAAKKFCDLLSSHHNAESVLAHRKLSISDYQQHRKEWRLKNWLSDWSNDHNLPSKQIIELGKDAELYAEQLSLRPDENIYSLLEILNERNIITIAVSDMWLEQEWLSDLLKYFEMDFKHVFTSVSNQASKQNGQLFPIVQQSLHFSPHSLLHIGDNILNDVLQPRRSGWHSIWTPQARHRFPPEVPSGVKTLLGKSIEPWRYIVKALQLEAPVETGTVFYDLGYNHLAPFLIIFSLVQWRLFQEQRIEHAFYLARDARLLLDAYDLIANLLPNSPQRHYLKLSRRSVALAHPSDYLHNITPLAGKVGSDTVGHWIGNFTISDTLKHRILTDSNLQESSPFCISTRDQLSQSIHKHRAAIEEESRTLRTQLQKYIYQTANSKALHRIAIVDTGWAGTIQDTLQAILTESNFISGIYIGVSHQGLPPSQKNRKYGLVRDDYRKCRHSNPWQATAGVIRVWDTLLRNTEGTTIGLQESHDLINSVQEAANDNEFMNNSIVNIRKGVTNGINNRTKTVELLATLVSDWSLTEWEHAATQVAAPFSTCPSKVFAQHLIHLDIEEGSKQSKTTSLGFKGIKSGTAFFPGLFSAYNIPFTTSFLSPLLRHQISKLRP